MHMCVSGIDFACALRFFLLDFGAVPTIWYFLFSIFIISEYISIMVVHVPHHFPVHSEKCTK